MTTALHETIRAIEAQRAPDDMATRVYNLRMGDKIKAGNVFLWFAGSLLFLLAAAQGYVSFRAQYNFVYAAKGEHVPALLEAIGLDTGAVIFALLGLAHARMGRSARIERVLNVSCALGSMTMNLLGANLGSPRSVAVFVLPPLLYAACSDRLIATVAISGGAVPGSVWNFLGTAVLYGLRALVAFPSTARGLRLRLLEATPLPTKATAPMTRAAPPPARPVRPGKRTSPTRGEPKKAVLLRLYATHPDHGNRSAVSRVAAELAPQAGLQPGTARTYLYAAVDGEPL